MRREWQGGSLQLAVLPLLLTMGLMAATAQQRLASERRSAANLADRQLAFQAAESALVQAERLALRLDRELAIATRNEAELFGPAGLFSDACANPANPSGWQSGLCRPTRPGLVTLEPAWLRWVSTGTRRWPMLHPCGSAREAVFDSKAGTRCNSGDVLSGGTLWANPRYLIELVQHEHRDAAGRIGRLYRLSARGWGRNRHSQATLQRFLRVAESGSQRLGWREVF